MIFKILSYRTLDTITNSTENARSERVNLGNNEIPPNRNFLKPEFPEQQTDFLVSINDRY